MILTRYNIACIKVFLPNLNGKVL